MKLVEINTVCNVATGKIMGDTQRIANQAGYETISFYGRRKGYKDIRCKKFGNIFSFLSHVFISVVFDAEGRGSYFATKKLIRLIKKENPNIIHLHNLHGYYLNYKLLFDYLNNEYKGKIVWTFHDCWPFTGHCPHFTIANCNKWEKECYSCPNKKNYPISLLFDNSRNNYKLKKELFTKRNDLEIIVPSQWLKNLVEKSFFKVNRVNVINNFIDLKKFKKTYDKSIYEKYKIDDSKKIVLGVANVWDERKGLSVFLKLANDLKDLQFVLVGLSKKQIRNIRTYKNVVGIERTDNQEELVKIYSIANVFINPSKEETFSMVCLEALACSVPVIVYQNTAMEDFVNEKNGLVCKKIEKEEVLKVLKKKDFDFKNVKNYSISMYRNSILKLYDKISRSEVK